MEGGSQDLALLSPHHRAEQMFLGPGVPPLTEQPVISALLWHGPGVLATAGSEVQGEVVPGLQEGCRKGSLSKLPGSHCGCVPRACGTVAPKHRIQGNNPQVPAGTEPILKAPQDVCSGWGLRKWAALGPHPV